MRNEIAIQEPAHRPMTIATSRKCMAAHRHFHMKSQKSIAVVGAETMPSWPLHTILTPALVPTLESAAMPPDFQPIILANRSLKDSTIRLNLPVVRLSMMPKPRTLGWYIVSLSACRPKAEAEENGEELIPPPILGSRGLRTRPPLIAHTGRQLRSCIKGILISYTKTIMVFSTQRRS